MSERSGDAKRPGRRRPDGDEDAAVRALRDKLSGVLGRLPDIERQVVEQRMGLVDGTPAKPGEVAERLGLTISEVKRIEGRAFSRIREVGPIKGLERFLER
jgi:DNA-directed RNA polymerase sigma subunit (sigma70/sigma32)